MRSGTLNWTEHLVSTERMSEAVVVDASLAVKWLIQEEDSATAQALLLSWGREERRLVGPHLLAAETTNALHRRVARGSLTTQVAAELIESLLRETGVELHEAPEIHARALELASELGQGAAYDCHYLALAEALDCELWTADERFHRAASPAFPFVHALSEVDASG